MRQVNTKLTKLKYAFKNRLWQNRDKHRRKKKNLGFADDILFTADALQM